MFSVGNRYVISYLWVENVNRWEVVLLFVDKCERNRRFGIREFDTNSSRSHTVFQAYTNNNKTRTLNIRDLAGSERAGRSTDRRKEGAFINKSLLALCNVVNNIVYDKYKLTRILQTSLDGYTNLVAICMLSPYANCMEESISTLKLNYLTFI
jgi:centromeric protein E